MREGGRFVFVKYRGSFIYICKRHHLEYCKPPTPRRATLGCAPDSQQSGPGLDPIVNRGEATWFVYKEGGRGRSSPAVPPTSVLGKRLPKSLSLPGVHRLSLSQESPPPQDELEAGLFWAGVMPLALEGFSGATWPAHGNVQLRDSCNSAAAFDSESMPCLFGLLSQYDIG